MTPPAARRTSSGSPRASTAHASFDAPPGSSRGSETGPSTASSASRMYAIIAFSGRSGKWRCRSGGCKASHRGVLSRVDSFGYRRSLRPCSARFSRARAASNSPERPLVEERRERVRAFMEEHVYANEQALTREDEAADALVRELQ